MFFSPEHHTLPWLAQSYCLIFYEHEEIKKFLTNVLNLKRIAEFKILDKWKGRTGSAFLEYSRTFAGVAENYSYEIQWPLGQMTFPSVSNGDLQGSDPPSPA